MARFSQRIYIIAKIEIFSTEYDLILTYLTVNILKTN